MKLIVSPAIQTVVMKGGDSEGMVFGALRESLICHPSLGYNQRLKATWIKGCIPVSQPSVCE